MIPRRPGPEASLPSQLTYSPTPNPALRGLNRPRHRFSSHADRARPNVPVLRPKAAPPSVAPHPSSSRPFVRGCRGGAQVPSVSRELETATTAVVGRPLRISEVLVTSSSGPNNACKATHRARLGLLWRLLSDRGSDFWARLTEGEVSRSCQVKKSVKRQCLYKPIALMPRALQNSHLFPQG